jgi:phosphoglycolate phosphatase-like HAD superfamily hydrolase
VAGKRFYNLDFTDEDVKRVWGKPYREMISLLYGGVESVEEVMKKYQSICHDYPIPAHAGAMETVVKLAADFLEGVVTAAEWQLIEPTFKNLNWPLECFFQIQTAEQTEFHKPDPRVFEPIVNNLKQRRIVEGEILYVGDAITDYYAARDAGLNFVAVITGLAANEEFLSLGCKTISSLNELPAYVEDF